MTKRTETYEICLAHAGRRDEQVTETVTITSGKQYRDLTDRVYDMNETLGITADKAYYGIRRAA